MGDITTTSTSGDTAKHKDGGISCPMLNAANYTLWTIRMKIVLKVHEAWDVVEQGIDDTKKNDIAIAYIVQSIPESLVLQLGDLDNAKKLWEAIKARYMGADRVKEARLQTLQSEFERLKMKDNDSINSFVGKISEIAAKSSALGESIEETKLVKKFLTSLPRKKYIFIVASIEQMLDLKTTKFEDIVGRLKAYEERVADEEDEQEENQSKLMYANNESNQSQSNRDYQGSRGRGGRFYSRGGRGRGRSYRELDMSKITCFRCDKTGHFASSCPDRLLKLQETYENRNDDKNDTHTADTLMMHEVVYLNEKNMKLQEFEAYKDGDNMWYLDNGASNHMTGNRGYFRTLDETVSGKVRFGDDSRIDIKGKGSILFCCKNGDHKVLSDVYYIPNLRSNIISLGQATESGCDVRMKEGYLTLHDKNGNLITKATRAQNRLYKVVMEIVDQKCLQLINQETATTWHARFGHIGTEKLKTMIRKELVIGLPSMTVEKETCASCLLGKQTKHPFPQATSFRAEHVLELVHGDLCGPIQPATAAGNRYIFVLIDDHSRYMWSILLKNKGDAFEKFQKFKAIVELETKAKIKCFRSDRGGEFTSNTFNEYCENQGIERHLTAPYTPQQNGVVERRNRTLIEMTRSLLKHMVLPNWMWGEAVRHATYLINRVSTRALDNQVPYEVLKGRKPNIEHLRIFGCVGYAKIDKPYLKKLDDRSKALVHLGTEPGSKAYRLYDPTTKRIVVSRNVCFDEKESWDWSSQDTKESGSFTITLGEHGNRGVQETEEVAEKQSIEEQSTEQSTTPIIFVDNTEAETL